MYFDPRTMQTLYIIKNAIEFYKTTPPESKANGNQRLERPIRLDVSLWDAFPSGTRVWTSSPASVCGPLSELVLQPRIQAPSLRPRSQQRLPLGHGGETQEKAQTGPGSRAGLGVSPGPARWGCGPRSEGQALLPLSAS